MKVIKRSAVCLSALLVVSMMEAQSTKQDQSPTRDESRLDCTKSLWTAPSAGPPEETWKSDSLYTQGGDPDKGQTAYYTGDTLLVSENGIGGLFKQRRADLPNTNLKVITFDAREIIIDGPLYFSSVRVRLYADTVRFTARGSLSLSSPPLTGSEADGVEIIAQNLILDPKNPHPLAFMTEDPDWPKAPDGGIRNVTLAVLNIQGRTGNNETVARGLTLDSEFPELLPQKSTAYSVPATRALNQTAINAKLEQMLWPEEFADKIAREFARGPFDSVRTGYLTALGKSRREPFLKSGHTTAAATLDNVFAAIREGVDELGFQPYFIPRTSFDYEKAIFLGDTTTNPTDQGIRGRLISQISAWNSLLVALKTKNAPLDLRGIDDIRTKSVEAETKATTALTRIDELQNQSIRINSDLTTVKDTFTQEAENIKSCRNDLSAHDRDKKTILTVARVGATVAAVAVSGPGGLAIGAALNVAGTVVAGKSTDGVVDTNQIIQALPGFIEETTQLQKDATSLKQNWKNYQSGKEGLMTAGDDLKKQKAAISKRDAGWGKFQDSLSETYLHGAKLAGTLSTKPPNQVAGDSCEAGDQNYQDALKRQVSLIQEQAQVNDVMKTQIGALQSTRDELAELSLKEQFILSAKIRNDQQDSRLEALAWMLRQRHIRDLAYNTGVLLRSYKYHTGKDVVSSFNSTYFATYYRLQRPLASDSSGSGASTLWPSPEVMQHALSEELDQLTREMNEVQNQVEQGYKEYLAELGTVHQDLSVPLTISMTQQEKDETSLEPKSAFLRAVNDEIDRQISEIDRGVVEIRPVAIPLPEGLTFFASLKAQKIYDAGVTQLDFEGTSRSRNGTLELGIIHPFTGVVYFQNNCATVDLRKHDDPADVQTYWSSCSQDGSCTHKAYLRDDLFKKENRASVALPLYAPYFLTVRVRSQRDDIQEKMNPLKSISMTFSYIE